MTVELLCYLVCLFYAFSVVGGQSSNPVVRVQHGLLSGSWLVSTNGRTYASFKGIPYARPPVGKYRFREPQHLKPWAGVWDATRFLSQCIQYDSFIKQITGSENCLFLNVYTPNLNAGASLPVLVFIHGGAFMYGGSTPYDPSHLMDRDMVVVTLNYRLGPIGFLSTGDEQIPGNAGLKDQAFALKWVRENIMMFGGNPDSITLSGCSAGGASVHYHYLSPQSKGNFARGMAISGSAFAAWTHSVKPLQKAKSLASLVGCPTTTTREMAECLNYRPAEVIVQAQIDMFEWKVHMFTPFVPTVEAPNVKNPFLTTYPYQAAKMGMMNPVPLMTSVTSEEGLYPAAAFIPDPTVLPELESRWEQLAPFAFEYNDTVPSGLKAEVASKIKQHYLGGRPVSQDTFPQLVQALGDRHFVADVGELADIHARKSGQPVYVYRYCYRGSYSLSNLMAGDDKDHGVSHADDLLHMFKHGDLREPTTGDKQMIDLLLDMIYSYMVHGTPKVKNTSWLQVTPGSPNLDYMEISSPAKCQMKSNTDFGHRTFWNSLGLLENERYNPIIRDEL